MSEPRRVPSNGTVEVGGVSVTNRTANSILVKARPDGSIEIVDCCLEEQGK